MEKLSHVVITGASGFVGQTLISQLSKDGISVTGVSRRRIVGLSTVTQYADILVPEGAVLVHLAQCPDVSEACNEEDIELCRKLSKRPWRHIVYVSSAIVYGDAKASPRKPEEQVSATSDYARIKLACEAIVLNVGGTCLRFANLYGPGMAPNTVVSDVLRQIPGAGDLIMRDVYPVRDFVWIEDVARCLLAACVKMPSGILNVGSGRGIAVGDMARLALALAGEASRPVVGVTSLGKKSSLTLDISRTQEILNWAPEVDISTGISLLLKDKK